MSRTLEDGLDLLAARPLVLLTGALAAEGMRPVTGGTDTHLVLLDLQGIGVSGRDAEARCDRAGIVPNKNAIPFDPAKPAITSGIRLGTPAATTRGFGTAEFREVGLMINEVLEGLSGSNDGANGVAEDAVRARVHEMCARFPIYPALR